jgi:hypothetical protein
MASQKKAPAIWTETARTAVEAAPIRPQQPRYQPALQDPRALPVQRNHRRIPSPVQCRNTSEHAIAGTGNVEVFATVEEELLLWCWLQPIRSEVDVLGPQHLRGR